MAVEALQGAGSRLRHPYFNVVLNDSDILTGVLDVEVVQNTHFSADTFRITCAVSALPPGLGIDYWDKSTGDQVEIFGGLKDSTENGSSDSQIVGLVDDVDFDPMQMTMTLTGRDRSSIFIDTKTTMQFEAQSSSEIAQYIAEEHGFKTDISTTPPRSGTFYQDFYSRLHYQQTEWDILCFLAEQEGYEVWVTGNTLHFQPSVSDKQDPYVLLCPQQDNKITNALNIKLHRNQRISGDVIVKVQSWRQSTGKTVTATARSSNDGAKKAKNAQAQTYYFSRPDLTEEQALAWAKAKAEEITRFEKTIDVSMPGDNLLTTRSLVKLIGSGSDWDQNYYIQSITRELSFERGYSMSFRAKNHSTEAKVLE